MFPDLTKVTFNTPHEGKAFSFLVESSGMGISDRHESVKIEQWDACTDCPAYDSCYKLGIAKILLHLAAQGYRIARAL